MATPRIAIISPALAKANNGNWQTAQRWSRFLRQRYRVALASDWDGQPADAVIALHARRSAQPLADFAAAHPSRAAILVLTGTDLYRDIRTDAVAQHSLELASRIVVLQEAGLDELDPALRRKACVIHQSAPALKPVDAAGRRTAEITMIGHLRDEKDPETFIRAAAMATAPQVRFVHIGGALDPGLGALAAAAQQSNPHYRWLGNLPHAATRQRLKRVRLMAIASKMEGGANVIIEAVTSGVPVVASDIPGNRGMLGKDYAGYFPVGDAAALARLVDRVLADPGFDALLRRQCRARAALFAPEREKAALLQLMDNVLNFSRATE